MGNKNYEIEPIVFVNNPIKDPNADVIGFETHIKTIEKAIDENAMMIGIVADYGTGKSSITDMLCNDVTKRLNYPHPIQINMWDCLYQQDNLNKKNDNIVTSEIGDLTRSFLFQLANGKNRHLASYINKRLSNNYGIISFSLNSVISWICIILAVVVFSISKFSNIESLYINHSFPKFLVNSIVWLHNLSPLLLGAAIILIVFAVSLSSVAFSHWKMEKHSFNEVNDIFDTYEYIINKLKPHSFIKPKKQIIIIEDLDRISDKSVIIGFLKELYRFQTSLEKNKEKFVFIISIKPEIKLKTGENHSFEFDDNKIYSKIFDVTISLKPLHYDDYDSVLIALLNSNEDKKQQLEDLIKCQPINNSLPESFYWIKKGTNLTIRELKDRLNSAIEIMVSIKNKDYKVQSSCDFEACAAVSYLEHQYPKDYNELINDEVAFAQFIKHSYELKRENKENILAELKKSFAIDYNIRSTSKEKVDFDGDFVVDLCELVIKGTFDEDFRMYFYTYPQNSHIKTTDEKYLCDLLQLPYSDFDINEFNESVAKVYSVSVDNIVTDTIKKISIYPDIVLYNNKIFNVALEHNTKKVYNILDKYVFSNSYQTKINKIDILKFLKKSKYQTQVRDLIIKDAQLNYNNDKLLYVRELFIKSFDEDIVEYKSLFEETPLYAQMITKSEIDLIKNENLALQLVCPKLVKETNFEYIKALLVNVKIKNVSSTEYEIANNTLNEYISIIPSEIMSIFLLDFMMVNCFIDGGYFSIVLENVNKTINKDKVAKYLNKLYEANVKLDDFADDINDLNFETKISSEIIKILIDNKLYFTPLLFCSNNNCLDFISFSENISIIKDEIKYLITFDDYYNYFVKVRGFIVEQGLVKEYEDLFGIEYPLITYTEFNLIDNKLAFKLINTDYISDMESSVELCQLINSKNYNNEEVIELFNYLFNDEYNENCITDSDVIKLIIKNINFKKLNLNRLTENQRDYVVKLMIDTKNMDSIEAIDLMLEFNCLVPSLEIDVQEDYNTKYADLLCDLNSYTTQTLKWFKNNTIVSKLPFNLCNVLKNNNCIKQWIISESLNNKCLIKDNNVDFDNYISVFCDEDGMFDLMSSSIWFLEKLMDSKEYSKLSINQLHELYKIDQIEPLFNYVFTNLDTKEKLYYLNHYQKFRTESDSKAFQVLVCQDNNLELLGSWDVYYKIRISLWESNPTHKAQFTKLWNRRWKNKFQ